MTEYFPAKTGEYPRILPNFQNCARCEKDLKDIKENSPHLGRKYARIFVLGHYLFLIAHSFPRASLSENCLLLGTDNVREQIFSRQIATIVYLAYTKTVDSKSEELSSQYIVQFKQLERRSLKNSRLQRDSNPWPLRYRCDALPTELWSHTLEGRPIYWVDISRERNDVKWFEMMWSIYEMMWSYSPPLRWIIVKYSNFQNCARCGKDLKDNNHNSLYLGQKYLRIFVLALYLFLEADSLGEDNVRGQIS